MPAKRAFSSESKYYFDRHVCPYVHGPLVSTSVRDKNFFSIKSPWNHSQTLTVEELEYAREAGVFMYYIQLSADQTALLPFYGEK